MAEIQDGSATFVVRDKRQQALIDLIYPVGTIYMSEDASFNPNTTWGVGTWVKTAINRVLQGTNDANKVGTTIDAGLQNITGGYDAHGAVAIKNLTGSFYGTGGTAGEPVNAGQHNESIYFRFDASRSNPIYGSSATVQPPAELVFIWKRIA